MTDTHIHTFTASGLGTAPFSFAGVDEKSDGCRHCGAPIRNRFHIVSADGVRSVVGSTCILKTGDKGLIDIAKAEKNRRAREKAQAKRDIAWEAARPAREAAAAKEAKREAAAKAAHDAKVAPVIALLEPLADDLEDGRGGFRDSIARDLRRGNIPAGNGRSITTEILAKQAGRRNSAG